MTNVKPRFNGSPCWKALLKVKYVYLAGRNVPLKKGGYGSFLAG